MWRYDTTLNEVLDKAEESGMTLNMVESASEMVDRDSRDRPYLYRDLEASVRPRNISISLDTFLLV